MSTKSLYEGILGVALFFIIGGVYSCSSEEDLGEVVVCPVGTTIRLKATKTTIMPFEDIKVSVDVDLEILKDNYDSIRWVANGVAYAIFTQLPWSDDDSRRDIRVTDYLVGKHKVYAFGYKNGAILSKDSIEYEVKKTYRDFISINWSEKEADQYFHFTTGRTPINYMPDNTITGVTLCLSHIVERQDIQYATLGFIPWSYEPLRETKSVSIPDITGIDWMDESREGRRVRCETEYLFLRNYMTDLYGAAQFVYDGNNVTETSLTDVYRERFSYKYPSDCYPIEIWETPSSYISILCYNDYMNGENKRGPSLVVAQPRR